MNRLVEGLWDCPYCDAKGIGGLQKTCPNCGHPQDKGTKFYLNKNVRHLSDEESKDTGTKQDWICAYCGSYNNDKNAFCTNCGSSREEKDGTYFSQKMFAEKKDSSESPPKKEAEQKNFFKKHPIRAVLILLGVLAVLISLGINLIPTNHSGIVQDMTWERSIQVEEFKTVRESDWSVPEGGTLVETKREIRSYQQVLDHYESVAKQVAYEVPDGYDIEYSDNGNGTFSEISTPRYRTEYRTEYEDEPVYRDEPVYDNKYYYDIDKWCDGQLETTSGLSGEEPYWPNITYASNQREKERQETYTVICYDKKKENTYTYACDQGTWEKYKVGQAVDFVVKAGKIIELQ